LNYHFDIDEKVYVQLTNSQFSQLILNLVINSSRACLDTDAEICISSQVVSKDEINLNAPNTLFEGEVKNCDFVNIQIKDNGIGMDEVMITRIFDPFFTNTKGGRGLGLSVVQGIVFQNRGVIQVNSSLGNGTSINIYLPLTKSTIAKKDMKGQKNDIILMSKTILLCEDDPAVRRIITTMLKRLEHVVIEAEDGVIGIQKFEANMKEIDLVILDLTMPNMSGKETYNLLIQLKNDIPILISSGYSEESISEFTDYQFVDFLQKPYKLADLNSKIKDILML
ncbi:MAG: response regulator, partial [Candidatus Heimdallarchaeota archaeon]|nr:response regulator [Candidatus Heimdallarchaeota archaeon]